MSLCPFDLFECVFSLILDVSVLDVSMVGLLSGALNQSWIHHSQIVAYCHATLLQRCSTDETRQFKLNETHTRGKGRQEQMQDLTKLRIGTVQKYLATWTHWLGSLQWPRRGKTTPEPHCLLVC